MAFEYWNVRVHSKAGLIDVGQVGEDGEENARCAALAKFGIPEDEDTDPEKRGIRAEEDFDVSPV